MKKLFILCLLLGLLLYVSCSGSWRWCQNPYGENCKTTFEASPNQIIGDDGAHVLELNEDYEVLNADSLSDSFFEEDEATVTDYNGYECRSNCFVLFNGHCARCNYPFAFYNKDQTPFNKCFESSNDFIGLKKAHRRKAAKMCRSSGECSCAFWEQMESHRTNSCRYTCSYFTDKPAGKFIFIAKTYAAQVCKQGNKLTSEEKQQIKEWCENGTYTNEWLKKKYNAKKNFYAIYYLKASEVLDDKNRPTRALNEQFTKYLGANKTLSERGQLNIVMTFKFENYTTQIFVNKGYVTLRYTISYHTPTPSSQVFDTTSETLAEMMNKANAQGMKNYTIFNPLIQFWPDKTSILFRHEKNFTSLEEHKLLVTSLQKHILKGKPISNLEEISEQMNELKQQLISNLPAFFAKNHALVRYLKGASVWEDVMVRKYYKNDVTSISVDSVKGKPTRVASYLIGKDLSFIKHQAAAWKSKLPPEWIKNENNSK